jgi:hypothetical protein
MLSNFQKHCKLNRLVLHSSQTPIALFSEKLRKQHQASKSKKESINLQNNSNLKSITAKMRQAAKNEHNKYQYDQATGEVYKKDKIEDLAHIKGMHEKDFVTEVFLKRETQAYLHKYYQIIPVMINRSKIRKVII